MKNIVKEKKNLLWKYKSVFLFEGYPELFEEN
jgi:hypothetical protein